MRQPLLFNTTAFLQLARSTDAKVRRSVEQLTPAHFTASTAQAIAAALYEDNFCQPVSVQTESVTQAYPEEIKVPVADENNPMATRLADGRRFRFNVPYTGNKELLSHYSYGTNSQPPFGEVQVSRISFTLGQAADGNIEDIIAAYTENINHLAAHATALAQDVDTYNTSLQQEITQLVAARKARLDKDMTDAQSIGVPIQ